MSERNAGRCEACGQSARVRVLEGYNDAGAIFHEFCFTCADDFRPSDLHATRSSRSGRGRSIAPLLLLCGAGIVIAIAAVDIAGFRGHAGFGLYQKLGLVAGAVLLTVGAVLRVDFLAVAGAGLLGLVVVADGVSDTPGLGWKQQLAIGLGLALAIGGLFVQRRELGRRTESRLRDGGNSV